MIEFHKRQIDWWKSKLRISDYAVAWIAFVKGLIFGLLIYHYLIIE